MSPKGQTETSVLRMQTSAASPSPDNSQTSQSRLCSTGVGTSTGGGARSRKVAMASTLIGKQAVVIGAGMGGLTAAAALADRFDQVVVLERDTLPSEPAYRAWTPQARHVHALLLSGQRALSELFPGFEQDLARAGAVPLRAGLDVRIARQGYHT